MLDWLIIGGGIHGTHLSLVLMEQCRVPRHKVRVLDPAPEALAVWRRVTRQTGMVYLRSPYVHNLDLSPWSVRHFINQHADWRQRQARDFIMPNWRPSLPLFQAHCDWVLQRYNLNELRLQARATNLTFYPKSVRIETTAGQLQARRVVLALGLGEQLNWPSWAKASQAPDTVLQHVFSESFSREAIPADANIAVIGGGMSAAQLALSLLQKNRKVTIVAQPYWSVSEYDFDPGWAGSKYTLPFQANPSMTQRRNIIQSARMTGSIPHHIFQQLCAAVKQRRLQWAHGFIHKAHFDHQQLSLSLLSGPDNSRLLLGPFTHVILATGFSPERPGGAWLDRLVKSRPLPCAPCGYPILTPDLQWHPRLHVIGPLAELELGPSARNIIGARQGAQKIVQSL